jgi:hypothetical protein
MMAFMEIMLNILEVGVHIVDFILNHLFVIISLIILLLVMPIIFRFFIKMAITLVIIAFIGSMIQGPKSIINFKEPIEVIQNFAKSTIQPMIMNEFERAKFSYNPETKQYIIQNPLFKLIGFADQTKADIIIKGKKQTIDVTFLKSFIEKQIAQQNDQPEHVI